MDIYEPTKREIIEEILRIEGSNLLRRQIRNLDVTDTPTVEVNPFNPTDSEYLTKTLLGLGGG